MRLLVTGSRDFGFPAFIVSVLDEFRTRDPLVIVGDCRGPDAIAKQWVEQNDGNALVFAADWDTAGKAAGPLRNQRMVTEGKPDEALAFWDGISRGTLDCLTRCVKAGVPVRIIPKKWAGR